MYERVTATNKMNESFDHMIICKIKSSNIEISK